MTLKEFRDIALQAAKGTAPETFSMNEVNAAFIDGLKELAGSYNQFMKNRYDIYDIIIESIDQILPKNVIDALGSFAEVKVVGQGDKAMFRRKLGRQRAKKFLTQVGLSGVYETFRLDADTFEVSAHAVGGGATIDFERMLDGAESLAEVVGIVTEGLENAVYIEVQKTNCDWKEHKSVWNPACNCPCEMTQSTPVSAMTTCNVTGGSAPLVWAPE